MASVGLDAAALDRTVDPCEDFYQFACGGWIKSAEIPAEKPMWVRSFSEISKRNREDLKAILEQARTVANTVDPSGLDQVEPSRVDPVAQKLGKFYGACMDEAAIEKAGLTPIRPLLRAASKIRRSSDVAAATLVFHQHGVWPLFDIAGGQDYSDATQVIAFIDQNGLGLPDRDFYLQDTDDKKKIRKEYRAHVARMMQLAGRSKRLAARAAKDVMTIETALAKIAMSRVDRRDPKKLHNLINRPGVVKAAGRFKWKAYFAGIGQPDIETINVTSPAYLEGINKLLGTIRPSQWRSYFTWHALHRTADTLPKAFVDEHFKLTQLLRGIEKQEPRWRRCVIATDSYLGELLAQTYVKKRFAGESKTAAERYVSEIATALRGRFKKLGWMDDATRTASDEKLKTLEYLIGFPDKWKTYDFEVTDSYASNVLAGRAWQVNDRLSQIGQPVDRGRWEMTPPTVNAYYHPRKNHMVFPAGILQPPFYSVDAHVPVNLGGMGMVVGHELTHGFDDEGSQYDPYGNLKAWWPADVRKKFEEQTKCVENQYAAYEPLPGVKLNGKLTLGENIADLGGLTLAFRAFQAIRADAKVVKVAEGFTEAQQFFLGNAQAWCSKIREPFARMLATTDPHSPPRFRVNGPMTNIPAFAEAFQCKKGSKMNPDNQCLVW